MKDMLHEELVTKDRELTELLVQVVQNQRNNAKTLIKLIVILSICFTVIIASMIVGFFWYESQFEYVDTYTYTEETTQEVDGDNATINNVEGNQYNDSAIHNESKGEGE